MNVQAENRKKRLLPEFFAGMIRSSGVVIMIFAVLPGIQIMAQEYTSVHSIDSGNDFVFNPCREAWVNGELWKSAFFGSGNHLSVAFGDLDSDGDPDLVQGTRYRLEWRRNTGDAENPEWENLDRGNLISQWNQFWTPELADIDGDNDLDLFCGTSLGYLSFWENTGDPGNPVWADRVENYGGIPAVSQSCPVFCDIDNDGDQDLFIGGYDGTVRFYRNTGDFQDPVFQLQEGYNIETGTVNNVYPDLVDIDGDSDFDLFVGTLMGTVLFYRNTGTSEEAEWSLESSRYEDIDLGFSYLQVHFSDINGNSLPDFFITDMFGRFFYYENTGVLVTPWDLKTRHFTKILDFGRNSAPAAGDIDGDGDMDVIVGTDSVYILENTGTSQNPAWEWQGTQAVIPGDSWFVPELADIDGDADPDLFVGTVSGRLYFYENTGTTSAPEWSYVTNHYNDIQFSFNSHVSAEFADIDHDLDLDMFVQHYNTKDSLVFYENTGTSESPEWTLMDHNYMDIGNHGIVFGTCDFGDLDRDGDQDCIFGSSNGKLYYYENTGDENSPVWNYTGQLSGDLEVEGGSYSAPCFADLNDDSYLDILSGLDGGGMNLWWNNTGGTGIPGENHHTVKEFTLWQNYPNPFNSRTEIRYCLHDDSDVLLTVNNICGNPVRSLVKGKKPAGTYNIFWDGIDQKGFPVVSGVYLIVLKAGNSVQARKMLLIR